MQMANGRGQRQCNRDGLSRREFMHDGAALLAGAVGFAAAARDEAIRGAAELLEANSALPLWKKLPPWYGFNLPDKMKATSQTARRPYRTSDFDSIASWGFNFVRLPLDYRIWTVRPGVYDEAMLRQIDAAVEMGRDRGIHVNLALFGAPGRRYPDALSESIDLWADGPCGVEARRQFGEQWRMFALRYEGMPSSELSFNLINEPSGGGFERVSHRKQIRAYVRAATVGISAVRTVDPDRLIIADAIRGRSEGYIEPVTEFTKLRIAQSIHWYVPAVVTEYGAPWVSGSASWPVPRWPYSASHPRTLGRAAGGVWDKGRLAQLMTPARDLIRKGVGVHAGEVGCYNRTPHSTALSWMRDVLDLFRKGGIGWALWSLRGPFGILDSWRRDVRYESYAGHKLDRAMLELLIQHRTK
jgi:endoglucanase